MRTPYQNELMHADRQPYENELMHYGVLGMRWGYTKGKENGGRTAGDFIKSLLGVFGTTSGDSGSGGRGTGGGGSVEDEQGGSAEQLLKQAKQEKEAILYFEKEIAKLKRSTRHITSDFRDKLEMLETRKAEHEQKLKDVQSKISQHSGKE